MIEDTLVMLESRGFADTAKQVRTELERKNVALQAGLEVLDHIARTGSLSKDTRLIATSILREALNEKLF